MNYITNLTTATDDQIAYELLNQLYWQLAELDQPSNNLCPGHERQVRMAKQLVDRRMCRIEDIASLEYAYSK
jgi:hypothetical protein